MNELLEALDAPAPVVEIDVDGQPVKLTSLDRTMWPRTGATKRDLVRYYVKVAARLLPHISGRPLTLARYPEGVEGPNWFQTRCPHPPAWVSVHPVRPARSEAVTREYCLVHDLAGLLWAVNLSTIEFHPLLARSSSFDEPDAVVFDLDPGPPASLVDACRIGLRLRDVLKETGLTSFAKTSGVLGLHVLVPLAPGHAYDETKGFAREIAQRLASTSPDLVVAVSTRSARAGKVFVDWSQNDANKSIVAPYSMRALPWPAASAPVTWEEVAMVASTGSIDALPLHADQVVERAAVSDLFAPLLVPAQALP